MSVNYDGFIEDVSVGDVVLVDGGLISCQVVEKSETDVQVSDLASFACGAAACRVSSPPATSLRCYGQVTSPQPNLP